MPAVRPGEQARLEVDRVREALERRVRRAGLGVGEVEERLDWPAGTLEQALGGSAELRFEHIAGVLAALGLHPMEFFAEIYGPPPPGPEREAAEHPTYELSSQLVRWSSLRVLIWDFKEKGVFTEEEAEKLLAKMSSELPPI